MSTIDGMEETAMIGARVGCFVDSLFMITVGGTLLVIVGALVLFTGARDGCFDETKTSIEGT